MADSTTPAFEEEVARAGLIAVGGLAVAAVLGVWWALCHPRATAVLALAVAAYMTLGVQGAVVVVAGLMAVGVTWRLAHRDSFDWFWLGPWRRVWVYAWGWRQAITMAGLGDTYRHPDSDVDDLLEVERRPVSRYVPKLGRVRSDCWCDRVSVRMLAGQHPGMYEDRSDHLAHTFGALACRVESPRPGRVVLMFQRRDRLAAIVPALPIPPAPDVRALPIGVLEDGRPWTVQLAGSHLLVAGATGSGKGSVVWSLIRAAAPCVHAGTVQLWCVDPKGGMELAAGAPMFTQFAYDDPGGMADLLDAAVDQLHDRAQRMRAEGRRKHTPAVIEPLVVVVVDELAFLTAYMPDRELRKRISNSLAVLLSKGRAVGFAVVAALQDPRKEVAPIRDLFPQRIALRLTEPEQSRIVLGPGAHERGAECERIPVSLPGVAYVVLDGLPNPQRGRAGWNTDDDIAAMAAAYPARRGDVIDTTAADRGSSPVHATVIDLMPSPSESVA